MKKIYFIGAMLATAISFGQGSISALNTPYNENFDGMGATGTAFPTNWNAIRGGGTGTANQVLTMQASNGSANTGTIYNAGNTGSNDRSLGSISSNSTFPAFGMSFVNNTGGIVTEFNITALVKQWRTGSAETVNESMAFSYSLDATGLDNGTWSPATSLNINEILTSTTSSVQVDGDLPANQSNLNGTVNISTTPWNNGATLWIKWLDDNALGNDSLLAIDNFAFRATSSTLSISQNNIAGLKVYPNPAKNTLYVTSDSFGAKQVELFDVLGKSVLNTKVVNNTVNISSLSKGVYVAKITEEGKTATRKVVIE
ncbi:T9SS type A sorting domain-containing protein [Flavobacterium terrae]|uniref:Por secretion system C-terminal sorting domain-containing protein n=1 Tax=Flavobacterium terrae TaxID=415425 RepID=A0A1M6BC42_9FLAO|nr:T9SS type A sorting domain-containing protein [Flavobacterium terrae]SHI46292.1 Por secretion system C-terminal sorting domain-containing protein [Flavobacterium terrae]